MKAVAYGGSDNKVLNFRLHEPVLIAMYKALINENCFIIFSISKKRSLTRGGRTARVVSCLQALFWRQETTRAVRVV